LRYWWPSRSPRLPAAAGTSTLPGGRLAGACGDRLVRAGSAAEDIAGIGLRHRHRSGRSDQDAGRAGQVPRRKRRPHRQQPGRDGGLHQGGSATLGRCHQKEQYRRGLRRHPARGINSGPSYLLPPPKYRLASRRSCERMNGSGSAPSTMELGWPHVVQHTTLDGGVFRGMVPSAACCSTYARCCLVALRASAGEARSMPSPKTETTNPTETDVVLILAKRMGSSIDSRPAPTIL